MTVDEQKRALRQTQRARLASLSATRRAHAAEALVPMAAPLLRGARRVALFASLPAEIDTGPLDDALRARGIERALPRIDETDALVFHAVPADRAARDLPAGVFGVPTPPPTWPEVDVAALDLVFLPGLAFDDDLRRLGYGRGYYDRAVGAVAGRPSPRLIGLCFEEQRVPRVPTDEHDVVLDGLFSP